MREEYQQEVSKVHAPKELIDKTKIAMQFEEAKLKKGKRIYRNQFLSFAVVAAVFALVLIFVPSLVKRGTLFEEAELEENHVLLEHFELKPGKILPGTSQQETEFQIFSIDEFPEEFLADASSKSVVENIPVFIVKDNKTGYYRAAFQRNEQKLLMISETVNKDLLIEAVKSFLNSWEDSDSE